MSRTTLTLEFKMCLFLHEASYWAEKLLPDVSLPPLMPDEDNNFVVSLVLDFGKWWRHLQPKNKEFISPVKIHSLVFSGPWFRALDVWLI